MDLYIKNLIKLSYLYVFILLFLIIHQMKIMDLLMYVLYLIQDYLLNLLIY